MSSSDWIISLLSTLLNPTNCAISIVKEFTNLMRKPSVRTAYNTMELIIEQSWGAQTFTWQIPIMKCLNCLGIVFYPYVRLEYLFDVLNICDMQ